jgi:hypothetical protein
MQHSRTPATGKVEAPTSANDVTPKTRATHHTPVVPALLFLSQLTCLAAAGVSPRRFLELLAAHPEVPRACVGKLRVVSVEDFRALLARLSKAATTETSVSEEPTDDEPTSADGVLAALGLRRTGGSR